MGKNKVLGMGALVFGLAVTIYSQLINVRVELNEPGPRLFPLIAGLGILACGIGILITERKNQEKEPFLDGKGKKRLAVTMVILAAYGIGLNYLGFILSTPLAVFGLSRYFCEKKYNYVIGVIVAVATTALLHVIFTSLFRLSLPKGILF